MYFNPRRKKYFFLSAWSEVGVNCGILLRNCNHTIKLQKKLIRLIFAIVFSYNT